MEEDLLPLLPEDWHGEMRYFYFREDPFENKVVDAGRVRTDVTTDEIGAAFDAESFNPLDGRIIYLCDKLAAYLEAVLSIRHGIATETLVEARDALRHQFRGVSVGGFPFGQLFEYDYSV